MSMQGPGFSAMVLPLVVFVAGGALHATSGSAEPALAYPPTATVDQVDDYHGTRVADPYRWLEDDVRESDAVRKWVDAENAVTFAYLERIPARKAIRARMKALWDYEKFGVPVKEGGRYFYRYNDGLQNQDVIYVQESLEAKPLLLMDPNTWSADGTIALADFSPSPDGRYVAYLVQDGGSDWRKARVVEVDSRTVLDDTLDWLKFTDLSWARDSSGFYYSRFPETAAGGKFQALNTNMALYFHRLGTSQEADRVIYARPDEPEWLFDGSVTDDGRHLVITIAKGTDDRYQIVHQDLSERGAMPVTIITGFDYDYTLVGNQGNDLFFRTNNGAPRGRLIAIDVANPDPGNWREIIPESADVLRKASIVGGRIIAQYMHDASTVVRVFDLQGGMVGMVDLPGIGTATGFAGRDDDPETFFNYESFNTPATVNRFDAGSGRVDVFRQPEVAFNPRDYQVRQVFFTSRDGTRVPMFISSGKGTVADGDRPALLYGYGGFNISLTPAFSVAALAWMEMGGVYAVPNLRGGGEYGEAWHQAGTKLQKQNVFDDFIAAAEYLIHSGYTRSQRLAVFGRSNGGLLIGAVTNQRPDLMAAALPTVGVMDMLRFQRFTAGRFWVDDYGSSDEAEQFKALYAYSPYHNIRPGVSYPAVLVTTADTDDRVVPGHSFKYTAALQKAQAGPAPVLIRIETRAGHGAGVPRDKIIDEFADRWAFLVKNLHMRLPVAYGQ